jgi:hypothetical protein
MPARRLRRKVNYLECRKRELRKLCHLLKETPRRFIGAYVTGSKLVADKTRECYTEVQ